DTVRKAVVELRSRAVLEAAVDRDAPRLQKKRSRRIEAGARNKILEWAGDVAALLADWVTAVDDSAAGRGTWMADPIADLRGKVSAVRDQAISDLAEVSDSGRPHRRAALDAGLRLLNDALDLLAGTASVSGPELPAE